MTLAVVTVKRLVTGVSQLPLPLASFLEPQTWNILTTSLWQSLAGEGGGLAGFEVN